MPLVAAAAIGGIGSIAGGLIGASGAKSAANAQVDAANNAANVSRQNSIDALNFEKNQYANSLRMLDPYYETGLGGLNLLRTGMGIPGQANSTFNLDQAINGLGLPGSTNNNLAALRDILGGGGNTNLAVGGGIPRGGGGAVPMSANSSMFAKDPTAMSATNSVSNTGGSILGNLLPGEGGTPGGAVSMSTGNPTPNGAVSMSPVGGSPSTVFPMSGTVNAGTNTGGGAVQPMTGGADTSAGGGNIGFGSLLAPFSEQFKAPTVTDDPGYQFRLKQGLDALNNSAAARGGLLSGGTAKAMNDYAQGSASQEYGNAYNRALSEYLNRYNIFTGNQTNQFNKLADLAGIGQTAGNQLSTAGLTTGNNVSNTLLGSAGQIGSDLNAAGAARGSGYVGGANALSGAVNGVGNLAMLYALMNQNGGSGSSGGMGVI